jgi:mannosyltransferase
MRGFTYERVALLAAILLAFALRVYALDGPALRGDEAFSVLFARHAPGEMFRLFTASTEPHPPLSFLVLHYWGRWAGESEYALRFTSVCAGVLVVPLMYVLGRTLWGGQVGLVAAALLAFNPFYIWHAQEARMYAMSAAFCMASSVLFLAVLGRARGALGRRPAWVGWVAYGLVTALAIYTHYYAFLVVAFHGVYAILDFVSARGDLKARARPLGRWGAGLALAAMLYLPWFLSSWEVLTAYHGSARLNIPLFEPLYRCLLVFGQGQTLPREGALWFLPLWGGLFVGGAVVAWRRDRRSAAFLALYLSLPWVAIFVDSLQRPAFDERYFMVSTPPYYVLIALAWGALYRWRRALGIAVAVAIVAVCGVSLHNHYHNPAFARAPDWRALNAFFARHTRAGDVVIANYPDPATRYYYDFDVPWTILPESYPVDREATVAALDGLVQAHDRVWLTPQRWASWDAEGLVEHRLDAQAERVMECQVDAFRVLLYHTPRQVRSEMRPLDARLEGGIRLLGYALRDDDGRAVDRLDVRSGEEVQLTLYWQAESRLEQDYIVFAHLLDPTGWLRGQQDNQPRQGTLPTRAWTAGDWVIDAYRIPLATDAPPGAYALEVGMYRPGDGTRLQVSGRDADPEHGRILLQDLVRVP